MKWLWPQRCAVHVFHWTPSLSGLDQPIILYEDSLRLIEEDTVSCKTSSVILKLTVGLQATCPLPLCHHHTFLAAPVLTSCFSNCTGAKLSELPRYHLVDLDAANVPWAMPLICCLWVGNNALTSTAAALFWYTLYAIPSSL
jgi:hypothetical protein